MPARIQRITGISETDLEAAVGPRRIWTRLEAAAIRTAGANEGGVCPMISHYARFEAPFVRRLHRTISPETPFPFHVICTHEIAVRLLPELPRLGLRAVAGYLGHSVPEKRRCANHVAATFVVWRHLVRMLHDRGISTLSDLIRWMAETPGLGRRGKG